MFKIPDNYLTSTICIVFFYSYFFHLFLLNLLLSLFSNCCPPTLAIESVILCESPISKVITNFIFLKYLLAKSFSDLWLTSAVPPTHFTAIVAWKSRQLQLPKVPGAIHKELHDIFFWTKNSIEWWACVLYNKIHLTVILFSLYMDNILKIVITS